MSDIPRLCLICETEVVDSRIGSKIRCRRDLRSQRTEKVRIHTSRTTSVDSVFEIKGFRTLEVSSTRVVLPGSDRQYDSVPSNRSQSWSVIEDYGTPKPGTSRYRRGG